MGWLSLDVAGALLVAWFLGLVAVSVAVHVKFYRGLERARDVEAYVARYNAYALAATAAFYGLPFLALAAMASTPLEALAGFALLVGGVVAFQWLLGPIAFLLGLRGRVRAGKAGMEWLEEYANGLARRWGYRRRIRVYLADLHLPNAFAVSGPLLSIVVLDRYLPEILDRRELEAVVAHEVGHIVGGDSARSIALGFLPYTVIGLGQSMVFWSRVYRVAAALDDDECAALGAYCSYYAQLAATVTPLTTIFTEILGWLVYGLGKVIALPFLLYSRLREHRADIHAAKATGDDSIVAALEKMEAVIEAARRALGTAHLASGIRGALYIVPAAIASTHPSLEQRRKVVQLFLRSRS